MSIALEAGLVDKDYRMFVFTTDGLFRSTIFVERQAPLEFYFEAKIEYLGNINDKPRTVSFDTVFIKLRQRERALMQVAPKLAIGVDNLYRARNIENSSNAHYFEADGPEITQMRLEQLSATATEVMKLLYGTFSKLMYRRRVNNGAVLEQEVFDFSKEKNDETLIRPNQLTKAC